MLQDRRHEKKNRKSHAFMQLKYLGKWDLSKFWKKFNVKFK